MTTKYQSRFGVTNLRSSSRAVLAVLAITIMLLAHVLPAAEPELVVFGAKVITVDEAQPQATAFAVRGNKFIAVGSDAKIKKLMGRDTKVIDVAGRVVVPGFSDAHIHPLPAYDEMSRLGIVDCHPSKIKTIDALIARLREKAAVTPKGQWIKGDRYQDTKLGRHPKRADLDLASTEHPIYLYVEI